MTTVVREGHLLKAKAESSGSVVLKHPVLTPYKETQRKPHGGYSAEQAKSLRAVTFSGTNFKVAPHIRLEATFINELEKSKHVETRISLAEMLGRAQSINAMPALLALLNSKEPTALRITAIDALGNIGDSTNENSFTRATIGQELIRFYNQRKSDLTQQPKGVMGAVFSKTKEDPKLQQIELATILKVIGRLKTSEGGKLLGNEYHNALSRLNDSLKLVDELDQIIKVAQDQFKKSMEEKFKKPYPQIEAQLGPGKIELMQANLQITLSNGEKFRLGEIQMQQAALMKYDVASTANLLIATMDALAQQNNTQVNNQIKKALSVSEPHIKAKALKILGSRNQLSYNTDIYPNLRSNTPGIRHVALSAALHSNDVAAKQKVMELLSPQAFFTQLRLELTQNSMNQYLMFLNQLALKGDKFIDALRHTAANRDDDIQARQMSLLVLGAMAQRPISQAVSVETAKLATETLRTMALNPTGQTPNEKLGIAVLATKLWVTHREPEAIIHAFRLLNSDFPQIPVKVQDDLLAVVYETFSQDADGAGTQERHKRDILNVLAETPESVFSKDAIRALKAALKPDITENVLDPKATEQIYRLAQQKPLDSKLVAGTQQQLETLRPLMLNMLNHPDSATARIVTARLFGLLKDRDKQVVQGLIQKTRDPLAGMIDWTRDRSFNGDPSYVGANVRVNNLVALGNIGDADALDVMLDAIDEPLLRPYVVEPLGQLAESANATKKPDDLKKVTGKLLQIMADPNPSRAARAMRIKATNSLFPFNGGVNAIKQFIQETPNPNFKRHAISALISNNYALDPKHPDHGIVKPLLMPELDVEKIHKAGITGKGMGIAVIDGGYVDKTNTEAFQGRVHLPAAADDPQHEHPTMVATTAAGNGKIKGVAPDATIYSDMWPELEGADPMENYKKIIEGKLRGENNVQVINNSWGFTNNGVIIYKDVRDALKAFKNVVDLAEKAGIQFVFSAGNEGENGGFPSVGTLSVFGIDVDKLTNPQKKELDYVLDKVILVGASNTQGLEDRNKHKLAEFSSIGDNLNRKLIPTVVAPGVDMMVYSYEKGVKNPKALVNGTSFSGPYVSGLVALMVQANPRIKPAQIREILKSTAVKLPNIPDAFQGYGEVDPHAAIAKAKALGKRRKVENNVLPLPPRPQEPQQTPPSSNPTPPDAKP